MTDRLNLEATAAVPVADSMPQPRPARHCETMDELRAEIDRLDREIVCLLAERQQFIAQAGRIKQSRDKVRDEDRIADVIAKVRAAAEVVGAAPDLAETVYRPMIEWSIAYEFTVFDKEKSANTRA